MADDSNSPGPVLTPDVGPRIEAAFARAEPQFHLQDAKIGPQKVEARACRPDGTCVDLRLTLPHGKCAGDALPAWCVEFKSARPTDAPVLLRALAGEGHPVAVAAERGQAAMAGLSTGGWLLVWWLVPLALGSLVGAAVRLVRKKRWDSAWSAGVALVLGPVLGVVAAVASGRVGAMDGLGMALVATLVALVWSHARVGRLVPWLVVLASSALSLGALEAACRFLLPPPPVVQDAPLPLVGQASPRPDGLPVSSGELLVDCALHASVGEETSRCLRLEAPRPGSVIHLGDSMIFGSGEAADRAIPARISAAQPGRTHLNAGVPGTSLDVQLLLLQRILAMATPSRVVLYVMPGNDMDEVDQPAESCAGQPPLLLEAGGPRLRCPTADWLPRPWLHVLLLSRLPLPVAALMDHSFVARHLESLHRAAIEPARAHHTLAPPLNPRYAQTLAALRASLDKADIALTVVVMPLRRSVYGAQTEPRRSQLLGILRDAGLSVIDTQGVVDEAVSAGGESRMYRDQPVGDIHLHAAGLSLVADWLVARMP